MTPSARRVLRWWPVVPYPAALVACSLVLGGLDASRRASFEAWASTNLDNLGDHPVRALAVSAIVVESDAAAWAVLAALGLAGLVAATGPLRAVAVAASAHLLGTAVSEGALAVRIARGLEPASARSIVDVGPSFVVVGVLVAVVVAGRGLVWRGVSALGFGLLVPSLFVGLGDGDVAAVGHVTAIAVGAASGVLLLLLRLRAGRSSVRV